jgi:16S rRNA (cytosine967-C5)-methyltransferase
VNRGDRDRDRPLGRGGRGPRGGRPSDDPARMTAYQVLLAVHRDDAYANLILPSLLRDNGLSGRDAAFATELTYGTLRNRGSIDAIITKAADRDVTRIDPPARDALRLGVYQLLYTRVPDHAAVASTVDLVRAVAPGAAGFSNAVLRRAGEKDLDTWLAEVAPDEKEDPVGHLAIAHSHPDWIVRAFRDALGGDLDETARALSADNDRPEVHLCARPGRIDPNDLADAVGGSPGAFSPYAVYLPSGAPGELKEIRTGAAHVQDEGSQLVALALLNFPLDSPTSAAGAPGQSSSAGVLSHGGTARVLARGGAAAGPAGDARWAGERWLDLCAGPGGKAGLMASIAAQHGAHLTAVEVAEQRANMVLNAVKGLGATVLCMDGRDAGSSSELPSESFDRVLVDAPCTGLGSLRRRPESRWRKQPSDLPPLTKLQRELLQAAIKATRIGGLVAYVTCSPHPVETRLAVEEAVRRGGKASGAQVELVDARTALPAGMPGLGDGPMVQLWPHKHGTDAMFLALLRRTK